MTDIESDTAQKLLKGVHRYLRKTGSWHDKKIAGFNPSEFKVLADDSSMVQMTKNNGDEVVEISQRLCMLPHRLLPKLLIFLKRTA